VQNGAVNGERASATSEDAITLRSIEMCFVVKQDRRRLSIKITEAVPHLSHALSLHK
jgi:hypothetical protein